jgi:hypothetical protein
METNELIEKYLKDKLPYYKDLVVSDYELNGSLLKITYSYNPNYDWNKEYVSYDNVMEVYILDYMTWIYNQTLIVSKQ